MSSSMHVENKKKDKLILGKIPTDEVHDTTLRVKKSTRSVSQSITKNFVQACITMEEIVISFLMVLKSINLKQKTPKLRQLHYV